MPARTKLIQGTFILTFVGILSRFMGFFFRMFTSHIFGEENVGLYQLIFPVYLFCLSLSTAGIEAAISRTVAQKASRGKYIEAQSILYTGLFFSVLFSIIQMLLLQKYALWIAIHWMGDARCADLLLLVTYALPAAAIHTCISGYSYGLQKTSVPALSQLLEQLVRISFVVVLHLLFQKNGQTPGILLAVLGIVVGEYCSALYSLACLHQLPPAQLPSLRKFSQFFRSLPQNTLELMPTAFPLTMNRTAIALLQGIEATSIPVCLKLSGCTSSESLRIYGVLTGMALPCIFFPSALTNSLSVMLMPAVAQEQCSGSVSSLHRLILRAIGGCFTLGLISCFFFLITGNFIGNTLFHSVLAARFILTLAWLCPFLYTNTALSSILNGLGKSFLTLLINIIGLSIRLFSIYIVIPESGIQGYLWGLLISQLVVSIIFLFCLRLTTAKPFLKNTTKIFSEKHAAKTDLHKFP